MYRDTSEKMSQSTTLLSGQYISYGETFNVPTSHNDCFWPEGQSYKLDSMSFWEVQRHCHKMKLKFYTKAACVRRYFLAYRIYQFCKFKLTKKKIVHQSTPIKKYFNYYIFLSGVAFLSLITVPLVSSENAIEWKIYDI